MSSIEPVGRVTPLDLAKLEADVAAVPPVQASLPSIRAPSGQSESMPGYVEHQNGVPRAGALSAEAVVRDYEAAANLLDASLQKHFAELKKLPPAELVASRYNKFRTIAQFYKTG